MATQVPSSQWLRVRYEDVVAEPRKHIGDILDFSGLRWTDEFEREFAPYPFEASRVDGFRRHPDPASVPPLAQPPAATGPRYFAAVGRDPCRSCCTYSIFVYGCVNRLLMRSWL
mgnify:CR=1 FL=1